MYKTVELHTGNLANVISTDEGGIVINPTVPVVIYDDKGETTILQNLYARLVEYYIREKYSVSEELLLINNKNNEVEAFNNYYQYCEDCKIKAKKQLGLIHEESDDLMNKITLLSEVYKDNMKNDSHDSDKIKEHYEPIKLSNYELFLVNAMEAAAISYNSTKSINLNNSSDSSDDAEIL